MDLKHEIPNKSVPQFDTSDDDNNDDDDDDDNDDDDEDDNQVFQSNSLCPHFLSAHGVIHIPLNNKIIAGNDAITRTYFWWLYLSCMTLT